MTPTKKLKTILEELRIQCEEAEFNRAQCASVQDHARAAMWSARYNALDGFRLRAQRIARGPEKDE